MTKNANMRLELIPDAYGWNKLSHDERVLALKQTVQKLQLPAKSPPYDKPNQGEWTMLAIEEKDGKIDWQKLREKAEYLITDYSDHRRHDAEPPPPSPLAAETSAETDQGYVVIGGITYCTHAWPIGLPPPAPGSWTEMWANPGGTKQVQFVVRLRVDFEV